MRQRTGLWVLGMVGVAVAVAWGSPEHTRRFPKVKALVPESGNEPVAMFEPDEEMLATLDAEMHNWRIFDDRGEEVPYLLRPRRETRETLREVPVAMETAALNVLKDNRIRVDYRVPAGMAPVPIQALMIESACRDFEKQVTVWGSEDGDQWEPLAENQPIFDYSRFMDVRNGRVEIPVPRAYPRLRLEIANITESKESPWVNLMREKQGETVARESESYALKREDFRMERVRFLQRQTVPSETREVLRGYTVSGLRLEEDGALRETRVFFETARAPLRSVHLLTGSVNFSRRAVLEAASGDEAVAWAPVAAGVLSRVAIGSVRQEALALETGPGTRWQRYRLTIANQDNPPLVVDGIAVTGVVYEVLFFRNPARLYEVYYGGPVEPPPTYDIGSVLGPREPSGDVCRFLLAAGAANPRYDPKAVRAAPSGKRIMTVAVVLAVATLIWLVVKSARGVGKLDPGARGNL